MATWRDRLGKVTLADGRQVVGASFRGVPFFVSVAQHKGGRRNVLHEFPGRDTPQAEDLGRQARVFPVEAYVIGDGYMEDRNKLLAALETKGLGELRHPLYGTRLVAVTGGFTVRESAMDGGMATFAIEFTEATALFEPVPEPDPVALMAESTDLAK